MPMNTPNNGQSGQDGPPDTPDAPIRYERSHRWQDVPVDVLRAWYREKRSLRTLAKAVARASGEKPLAPETIRRFGVSKGQPDRSTVRPLAL